MKEADRVADVFGGRNSFSLGGSVLGENIIEVRPKASAHIWSNRNASNAQQGPGELVVMVIEPQSDRDYTHRGSAYFLFMGGKGCASVNAWGATAASSSRTQAAAPLRRKRAASSQHPAC